LNIFILSEDPEKAAQMQCDQHVVKMTLETAQILCSVFTEHKAPYKRTHYNHPCNVWARESKSNFLWLCKHGSALAKEYTYRYDKEHKSEKIIDWCHKNINLIQFKQTKTTPFALAMDEKYKENTAVKSYRNFYIKDKSIFAKWNKNRKPPLWYSKKVN